MQETSEHQDWQTAAQSPLMRRAAFSVISLGLFALLLGLQLGWWAEEGVTPRTLSMLAFGCTGLVLGRRMHLELDMQKTVAAIVFAGLTFALSMIWVLLLLRDGIISLLAAAVTIHAAVTAILCGTAVEAARQADRARQRLRSRGYEV